LSLKIFNLNKVRIFERGFRRIFKVQLSFSIHFFIIVILFVLFDLEVVILLGILIRNRIINLIFLFLIVFVFLGLYLE
jgi:NADH:ubiquinone oxidoreductase subunit 3 (subunit A)